MQTIPLFAPRPRRRRNGTLTQQAIYQYGSPYTPISDMTYAYDKAGNQTLAIDADGNSTASSYDALGNVTTQVQYNSGGSPLSTQSWVYDGAGNVVTAIDADGNTTISSYDGGYMTQQVVYASGSPVSTQSWAYDKAGNQTRAIDADGNTTVSVYDDNRLVQQHLYKYGVGTAVSNETFGYDPAGNETSVVDGVGNTTVSAFDGLGRMTLQSVYDPGHTFFASQTWAYDGNGNLTQNIDVAGDTTISSYDGLGEMTLQVVYDVGQSPQTQSWAFDNAGNVTKNISFEGFTTLSTYDDNELVTQIVDQGTAQVDYETFGYDAAGNVTSHLDNDGKVTASTYQGEGLISSQTITSGTTVLEYETWLYDGDGNVTDQIDVVAGQTRETRYDYNGLGQKTEEIDGYGSAASATIAYSYDDNGNLLSEVDADGNTTQFQYDSFGEVTWSENPMGYTSTTQFDADGNMTSEINFNGQLETFAYNVYGQVTSNVWYAGSTTSTTQMESIAFGYDANDNMTLASDSAGTYTMAYDPLGRLTLVNEPFSVSLNFGYDGNGNRDLVTDSFGDTEISVYDADNQLISREFTGDGPTLLTDFDHDYRGNVTEQVDYVNGTAEVTTITGYDANGNVTNIQDTDVSASLTFSYTSAYDAPDELIDEVDNGTTTGYAYNATGELTSAGTTSFTYDPAGNPDGAGYTIGIDNEVATDGTYNYTYDHAGNQITKTNISTSDTWTYTYNDNNELIEAVDTNSSSEIETAVSYDLDAFGNRIESTTTTYIYATPAVYTTTSTSTKYAIDQWNPDNGSGVASVWADLNAANGLQTQYVSTDNVNKLLFRIDSGTAYIYLLDRQNSTRAILSSSGTVLDEVDYDAFGNAMQTSSMYGGRFLYTGEPLDAVTGLQDNDHRWYDPRVGQWTSIDPMGFSAGDSNLYRYVNNAPTNAIDPSGKILVFVHGVKSSGAGFINLWAKMEADWRNKNDEQYGFQFDWRGPLGAKPPFLVATSTIEDTWKRPIDKQAVTNLIEFVKELQASQLVKKRMEPIFIIAHSEGTMITLTALEKGMKVNGVILLNSPLDINQNGKGDLQKALQNVSTRATFYWSPGDQVVNKINGSGPLNKNKEINLQDRAIENKFFQVKISGGHSDGWNVRFASLYADVFKQPIAANSLINNPNAEMAFLQLTAKWQTAKRIHVELMVPLKRGE